MKIVLPVHHFPPDHSSGAELYTLRLARWLIQHGHEAEAVCIHAIDHGLPDRLDVTRNEYEGVPVWRLSFDLFRAPQRATWLYNNPLLGEWFDQYLQCHRPDIAHFQAGYLLGIAPLLVVHRRHVPTVLTLHDHWFVCARHTLQRSDGSVCDIVPEDPMACAWCVFAENSKARKLDRYSAGLFGRSARAFGLKQQCALQADRRKQLAEAIRLPDVVITPSQYLANRIQPMLGAASGRLHVSRNGLDLERFKQVHPSKAGGELKIGYIGQIAQHKGVHLLVQAFRQMRTDRQLSLHLYGSLETQPAYVAQLKQIVRGDARVHFHGRLDNSHVPLALAEFDISVVPSICYENCPTTILEALAAGTPVVTAKRGGMAELVQDRVDGLHFAAGDAEDLARQLQRLLDDPDLLAHLQRGASASPTPRSLEDEMSYLMSIYRELV
jgi:glycosyltransferase involved in cell wall biosynthesis